MGMNRHLSALLAAVTLGLTHATIAIAGDEPDKAAAQQAVRDVKIVPVTTEHEVRLSDRTVAYRATVETLPVVDRKGTTTAQVAVIAYTSAEAEPATRPVTFVFNGGPGASSADRKSTRLNSSH